MMRLAPIYAAIRRWKDIFRADKRGITGLEYALIACVSVLVAITAFVSVGGNMGGTFTNVADVLQAPLPGQQSPEARPMSQPTAQPTASAASTTKKAP